MEEKLQNYIEKLNKEEEDIKCIIKSGHFWGNSKEYCEGELKQIKRFRIFLKTILGGQDVSVL